MFYYISGKLAYANPNTAVIDAGGVGYKLTISENTYNSLPPRHTVDAPSAKLFTYMAVREDGIELFGFASETELSSFKMLLSVSGVGPKAAISILSLLTPEKFALAVCTEDRKTISKANGIGPKTAARIILELKDKLLKETDLNEVASSSIESASSVKTNSGKLSEAQDALLVLGYSRSEALNVLKSIDTQTLELEEIIKKALKLLMK
ncbi:MAG: Holliday junction branch migration protein RuvA [Ruminococcaceae bacterium]|nr:Holliday junction branch migration protein RuvA [Oscillospiraceae bacterium]